MLRAQRIFVYAYKVANLTFLFLFLLKLLNIQNFMESTNYRICRKFKFVIFPIHRSQKLFKQNISIKFCENILRIKFRYLNYGDYI